MGILICGYAVSFSLVLLEYSTREGLPVRTPRRLCLGENLLSEMLYSRLPL